MTFNRGGLIEGYYMLFTPMLTKDQHLTGLCKDTSIENEIQLEILISFSYIIVLNIGFSALEGATQP